MKQVCRLMFYLCLVAIVTSCANNSGSTGSSPNPGVAKTDVDFAKDAFTRLANGDTAAENLIDWETFTSLGVNVGAQYNALPNEAAKGGFRTGFITSFSKSFQATGARAESLTNWRIQSQEAAKTVVAADTPKNAVLLLTVAKRDGQQKITALETSTK
ncbi:MAG: hypothetical protein JOZ57_15940 [Abitibacteriaceae bacterium]|nr:hypothetical protein [Abditibacteriaceae bacterium]